MFQIELFQFHFPKDFFVLVQHQFTRQLLKMI